MFSQIGGLSCPPFGLYVKELEEDKQVKMEYINTKEQIADIFTKPLPKDSYEYIRS